MHKSSTVRSFSQVFGDSCKKCSGIGTIYQRAVKGKKLPEKKKGIMDKLTSFGKKSKKA